ncbi:glycosyltransferase family 4 protein [Lachnospiraceae bacterium KGMB03038]|nr:glycosyltransferase family 4 protein [Lachnospiraceae bacterium KGMB03038]
MKIYIYKGGLSVVRKSGVGSAILHQEKMLVETGAPLTNYWKEATVVHINTVFPDAVLAARAARKQGKQVVYYGHSTMEDFKHSFIGSDVLAPLFKKWICHCYEMGDVIVTPTEYSRRLLLEYGIKKPIYAVTNGVDIQFFQPDKEAGERFRRRYHIPADKKVVISAGHLIERKGIFDFLELARRMPETQFVWFGGDFRLALPRKVKKTVKGRPGNVIFAGYVEAYELKEAYCGADAFAFLSYEETEGIVVLEALASGVPVLVRDIPVYDGWLEDGVQVYKANSAEGFRRRLDQVFAEDTSELRERGRRLAWEHSIYQAGMFLDGVYQLEKLGRKEKKACL